MSNAYQATYEEAIEIAKNHHSKGNLTLANLTYKDIIKALPDDYDSLHALAIISYQSANFEEGLEYIERALTIKEDAPESWNVFGVLLAESGNDKEAIPKWEKALEINPDYAESYINIGNSQWKLGNHNEAKASAEKAIELAPNYPISYINLGNALAALGEHEKAITAWEKASELDPKLPNPHINIGNALRDLGRIKEAEEYCKKALKLAPNDPSAHSNLGNVYRDLGQFEEAEDMYRKAIALKPNFVTAHNNLSIVLIDMLRFEEAAAASRFALAFDPNQPQAYTNLALALTETGDMQLAEDAARKALVLKPDALEARINLAEILLMSDRFEEAETIFGEALKMQPDSPRLFIKMSSVLERLNRLDEGLEYAQKAVDASPETPEVYHRLAMMHHMMHNGEKAIEAINKAIELKPNFPQAFSLKSDILQTSGNMEEALQVAKEGLELDRNLPFLYLTLSNVKKYTEDDPDFIGMVKVAENVEKFGRQQATALYVALARAYENIGKYDLAFQYLEKGNNLKRKSVIFDTYIQEEGFNKIKNSYTPEFFDTVKGKGIEDDTPIFIVGMPRSGTTLTEQIISSHPDVFGAGELHYLATAEKEMGSLSSNNCKEMGERYIELIRSINDESKTVKKITDKMPGNYARIGQITSILPNAKIIHCRRNPMDTCLSCYKQLFAHGQYWSYTLEELAEQYELYEDLMDHWRETIPHKFIEIYYEDTVNDFENQARKLIDYVGLEWNDACLSPHKQKRSVMTASKSQVRKPVYKTSVEGWRRYEEPFTPLAERLEKYVRKQ